MRNIVHLLVIMLKFYTLHVNINAKMKNKYNSKHLECEINISYFMCKVNRIKMIHKSLMFAIPEMFDSLCLN